MKAQNSLLSPARRSKDCKAILAAVLAASLSLPASAWAQKSLEDHPLATSLKKKSSGFYADFFDKVVYTRATQFLRGHRIARALRGKPAAAADVNAYDEVPDSSFFENRNGRQALSAQDIAGGLLVTQGPSRNGKWTVTQGKIEGRSKGFFIRDAQGDEYLLKFDPAGHLGMATGAEVISSRLFHAVGYHVAQYSLEDFSRDILEVDPAATTYNEDGFKIQFTVEELDGFLAGLPKNADGTYRASASLIIKGVAKGPFSFTGRRKGDPEDWVAHMKRRVVRALPVFCAWLNHQDIRKGNSLDVVVEEGGRVFVKHHLIDFGSTLGSNAYRDKFGPVGHVYYIDWGEIFRETMTLGLYRPAWKKRWETRSERPYFTSVGYFDNEAFDPGTWKSNMPHHAFDDRTAGDAYWAAKIVASFTDDQIRAAVAEGHLPDPGAEDYLVKTIAERRDRIVDYWYSRVSPLERIDVEGGALTFTDLAVGGGARSYAYRVVRRGGGRKRVASGEISGPRLELPAPDDCPQGCSVFLAVSSGRGAKPVRVELDSGPQGFRVASIRHAP